MSNTKQDKTRIVQIWGEILDEGFTSVPNILLKYRSRIGLKPKHIMLIIDIMSYKWDAGSPFPSYSALALRSGIEERSVKRITQDLEELGLLVKEPRFDRETGAQVTTVFDFRPLVRRLIEETKRGGEGLKGDEENYVFLDDLEEPVKKKVSNNGANTGGDKNVTGEGDKNVTGGVTELSPGGVTEMSPKEYSYRRRNNSMGTLGENSTYVGQNELEEREDKNRVSIYFRDGIFRKRIFETYDNLKNLKSVEELVEEGAYRAAKDIAVNRASDMERENAVIDPDRISREVARVFPYDRMPKQEGRARDFFTAKLCDLVSQEVSSQIRNRKRGGKTQKQEKQRPDSG